MTNNLFKNLLSLAVVASMAFLYSCGEDEETLPDLPTISATADAAEYDFGATVTITLDVTAPGELSSINTITTLNGVAGEEVFQNPSLLGLSDTETGLQTTTTTIELIEEIFSGATLSISIVAVDKDDQSSIPAVVEFTVGEMSPNVVEFEATLLGGQGNESVGSFYNAIDNEVYGYATTRDEQSANVDFLFFYGNTNMYTIAAMDDTDANTAFSADTGVGVADALGASIMETRNATRFKVLEATADEYDEVATEADLENLFGEVAAEATKVNGLSVDDVFGFQLVTDRSDVLGIVKVVATEGSSGADRSITFDVKITASRAN